MGGGQVPASSLLATPLEKNTFLNENFILKDRKNTLWSHNFEKKNLNLVVQNFFSKCIFLIETWIVLWQRASYKIKTLKLFSYSESIIDNKKKVLNLKIMYICQCKEGEKMYSDFIRLDNHHMKN